MDLNQECIYKTFGTYNLLLKKLDKLFSSFNLSASKFNILMTIKHQAPKEGINQKEICKHLLVCEANVAKITNKLLQEKYITRRENPKDRRYNLLKITKKGSDLLDEIWKIYIVEIEKLTNVFNKKEKEILIKLLSNWLNELNK